MIKSVTTVLAGSMLMSLLATPVVAFSPRPEREAVGGFCAAMMKGSPEEALDGIFEASELPRLQAEAIAALRKQTKAALELYGRPAGCEVIDDKNFGGDVVRATVVLKLERHPLVWEFFFYRSKERWLLSGVKFNDEMKFPCDLAKPQ